MSDENLVIIGGIAAALGVASVVILVVVMSHRLTKRLSPAWENLRTLFPMPEGIKISFLCWQKALIRYKPGIGARYCWIQATDHGLLVRKSSILFGKNKEESIYVEWDQFVEAYKPYYMMGLRFFRPLLEFQVYGTEVSIITIRSLWGRYKEV